MKDKKELNKKETKKILQLKLHKMGKRKKSKVSNWCKYWFHEEF